MLLFCLDQKLIVALVAPDGSALPLLNGREGLCARYESIPA